VTLDVVGVLAEPPISTSALSRFERGHRNLSDGSAAAVALVLDRLEAIRERYRGIAIDMADVNWLKREFARDEVTVQ